MLLMPAGHSTIRLPNRLLWRNRMTIPTSGRWLKLKLKLKEWLVVLGWPARTVFLLARVKARQRAFPQLLTLTGARSFQLLWPHLVGTPAQKQAVFCKDCVLLSTRGGLWKFSDEYSFRTREIDQCTHEKRDHNRGADAISFPVRNPGRRDRRCSLSARWWAGPDTRSADCYCCARSRRRGIGPSDTRSSLSTMVSRLGLAPKSAGELTQPRAGRPIAGALLT